MIGSGWLSTLMSPQAEYTAELKATPESGNSSPKRKNPKKAVHAMAHRGTL